LYAYAGSNPLKYIDPTGHVKVHPIDGGKPHELDVLSHLGLIFTCDDGSATIGVVMFITKGLGFVI
jgi:hypothetical protein